jgi:hypothetical protein
MKQVQSQTAHLNGYWCDTSLPAFTAEVERAFAFKGLAREFRVELDVDSLVDLALVILVPQLQRVIRDWYDDQGQALVNLLGSAELQALDAWLVGDVRHWTARWNALDPVHGGSAPATRIAVDRLREEIRLRPLPPDLDRAVASALAKPDQMKRLRS